MVWLDVVLNWAEDNDDEKDEENELVYKNKIAWLSSAMLCILQRRCGGDIVIDIVFTAMKMNKLLKFSGIYLNSFIRMNFWTYCDCRDIICCDINRDT